MGKPKQTIKNMEEFYKTYLPEYDRKYPITMRVFGEEADYLKRRRGHYDWKEKSNEDTES